MTDPWCCYIWCAMDPIFYHQYTPVMLAYIYRGSVMGLGWWSQHISTDLRTCMWGVAQPPARDFCWIAGWLFFGEVIAILDMPCTSLYDMVQMVCMTRSYTSGGGWHSSNIIQQLLKCLKEKRTMRSLWPTPIMPWYFFDMSWMPKKELGHEACRRQVVSSPQ